MKHESQYLVSRRNRLCLSKKDKESDVKKENKKPIPIAKKSKKTISTDRELKKLAKMFLAKPENKYCNIQINENCTKLATVVNHTRRRGVNKLNVETFEAACSYCNNAIENKDAWARENGHLKNVHQIEK